MNEVSNNQRGQAETAATLDRVNELRADAPGGSNYRRQSVPLPAIPSVPWSNLKDWVGNLTASLQSSGRPALPNDIAAALKAAANQERERAADAASPGAGAQFRQNNESYARALQHLDQLLPLSGEPLGASGRFADTPPEQRVAYAMTGKMQSPSDLEIFSHPAFPAEARLNAAGQHVSTLGNSSQGGFRPEKFVDEYRAAHPGLEELAHVKGQPLAALNVLDNASRLGENFSTPTSRFGLIKSLGAAAAVAKAMELTGKGIEYASGVPALKWIGTPALGRLYSEGLESEPVARAMAGQPQNWAETANRIPVIGANVDAREQDRQALRRKGTVTVTRP
jgi:hypothetical protein